MVRNNTSLKQAALDLGITLDPDEVTRIGRRKDFQEILRVESNKYAAGVANDPTRTKSVAVGKLWIQAEKLEAKGEPAQAAIVIEKIAKIEGWTGADTSINVFGTLSARELAEARERVAKTMIKPAEA